jgi:DNA polymerase I-like protein with 3'-5' exonuclease and polymerase domains
MSSTKLYGLDIETECAVEGCSGKDCGHALDFNRNRITVIAITDGLFNEMVVRDLEIFKRWLSYNPEARFTAHLGKFDIKQLAARGIDIVDRWVDDSCLLAFTSQVKIPDSWLADYELKRREQNKLRTGMKHREAGKHSLKTLAPYFLKVQPFWEPEDGHDDDEYVLTDARYALKLTEYFHSMLPQKSLEFYREKQLPWSKMLLAMELKGIALNDEELLKKWKATEESLYSSENTIKEQWASHFQAYEDLQRFETQEKYNAMAIMAKSKGKFSVKQEAQHQKRFEKALQKVEPLNLDSPKQLLWLLRDRLELAATNLKGEESTDKETLTRLAVNHKEVDVLLNYRKARKLCSTYFPEYRSYAFKGRIHPTFNATGTRTGRLSCSDPNLQQVPGALHSLFEADPHHVLITRDLSAIEPTILAYYSEDPVLCKLMIEGGDFHGETAIAAFDLPEGTNVKKEYPELRKVAKTIGLAVLYGAGANQVHLVLQKEGFSDFTLTDAKRIVTRIRERYKGVWEFKRALDSELETGSTIYNLFGRPLSIPERDEVYMKGLNTLIQSSASDLMQESAYIIWRDQISVPLLLVHDELVCQSKEEVAEIKEALIVKTMSNAADLQTAYGKIPIRTEGKISKTWEK